MSAESLSFKSQSREWLLQGDWAVERDSDHSTARQCIALQARTRFRNCRRSHGRSVRNCVARSRYIMPGSFYLRARDEWENLVSSCSWLDSQDGQPGSEDQAAMNHFVTLFTHTASHRTKPPSAGLYKAKLEERRSRRPARLAEDGQRSVGHVYMWHLGRRDCLCCYWNARHPTLDSFTVSSQYTGKVATSSQILDAGRSAQNASAPPGRWICYRSDSTSCAETLYGWAGCENITH